MPGRQASEPLGGAPSSRTDRCRPRPSAPMVTVARLAVEWRATLVSASVAMRYAATSTAAGRSLRGVRGLDGDLERGAVGAPVEAGGVLAQGADQAQTVQCGRSQVVDEAAHVVDGGGGLGAQLGKDRHGPLRLGRRQPPGGVDLEYHPGQRRAEAVVQVAAQPAALLLARGDEALPRPGQLARQHRRPDRDRDRRGEQRQDPLVGGVQPNLAGAQPDDELADRLVALPQPDRVPLAAAGWLLNAVGFAAASVVLLRTRNDEFDLPPAS